MNTTLIAVMMVLVLLAVLLIKRPKQSNFRARKNGVSTGSDRYNPDHFEPIFERTDGAVDSFGDDLNGIGLLLARIKNTLVESASSHTDPEKVKELLASVLKEHPLYRESSLWPSINEFILRKWETYQAVRISKEEVEQLWGDAD